MYGTTVACPSTAKSARLVGRALVRFLNTKGYTDMIQNEAPRPGFTFQGLMLTAFLVLLVLATSWLFMQRQWWLPELASVHGADNDRVFMITLAVTGVLFILLQLSLAGLIFHFGKRGGRPSTVVIKRGTEKKFALAAGLVILGVDLTLYGLGESQWFKVWREIPEDVPMVEVIGEQFAWNFRYPGPDGQFGRTDPSLITSTNTIGLDTADPAAKDDIVSINQLHLPENRPVRLILKSKDVIHSFYLPNQRIKQDSVPGLRVDVTMIPTEQGQFEVVCNQLCGLGHYRMRAFLTVESQESFNAWLSELAAEGGN